MRTLDPQEAPVEAVETRRPADPVSAVRVTLAEAVEPEACLEVVVVEELEPSVQMERQAQVVTGVPERIALSVDHL